MQKSGYDGWQFAGGGGGSGRAPRRDEHGDVQDPVLLGAEQFLAVVEEDARRHVIRHSPYTLDVRVLDVESEPDALLAQVDELAIALAASAGVVRTAYAA